MSSFTHWLILVPTGGILVVKGFVEDLVLTHDYPHGGVSLEVRVGVQQSHGARRCLQICFGCIIRLLNKSTKDVNLIH